MQMILYGTNVSFVNCNSKSINHCNNKFDNFVSEWTACVSSSES